MAFVYFAKESVDVDKNFKDNFEEVILNETIMTKIVLFYKSLHSILSLLKLSICKMIINLLQNRIILATQLLPLN